MLAFRGVRLLSGHLKILYFYLSDNEKDIKTSTFQILRLALRVHVCVGGNYHVYTRR